MVTPAPKPKPTDAEALDRIAAELSYYASWSDMIEVVVAIVRSTGRAVR